MIVVKYEDLNNYIYLKKIFNLDNKFITKLKKKNTIHHNKSISKTTINFILFLNNIIDFKSKQNQLKQFTKDIYIDGRKKNNHKQNLTKKIKIFYIDNCLY